MLFEDILKLLHSKTSLQFDFLSILNSIAHPQLLFLVKYQVPKYNPLLVFKWNVLHSTC